MNFDDFASQMTLKYQIAIATAVIKSKPNKIPIKQYINRLRNKIDKKMDLDSDVTVCSDDFKFDDDTEVIDDRITFSGVEENVLNASQETNVSVNILEGLNIDLNVEENKEPNSTIQLLNDGEENQTQYKINIEQENSESTFCEDVQSQNLLDANGLFIYDLSQHHSNKNNVENVYVSETRKNCDKDIVSSYNFNGEINHNDVNNAQSLPFDSQQTELYNFHGTKYNIINDNLNTVCSHNRYITSVPSQINLDNIQLINRVNDKIDLITVRDDNSRLPVDSQETELYSIPGFLYTTTKMRDFADTQNEYSIKQDIVSDNLNKNTIKKDIKSNENIKFDSQHTISNSIHGYDAINKHSFDNFNNTKNINDIAKSVNGSEMTDANINDINLQTTFGTQQTQLNSIQDFNEIYTSISQSQSQFVEIQKNQLYKTENIQNSRREQLINNTEKDNASIIEPIYKKMVVNNIVQNEGDGFGYQSSSRTLDLNEKNEEIIIYKNIVTVNKGDYIPQDIKKNKESIETINVSNYNNSQTNRQEQNDDEMFENYIENNFESQNSQMEIVPYKVMEDLNRVKHYLERKNKDTTDGSWSDSGYRSDSQSRSSFRLHLQTQDTSLNDSAGSLLDFILNSPLVLSTKDIINEISTVLGRLIDHLYVEEKYFLFLEEVLRSVDNMLKDIHEGQSYDEEVLLKKDASINRLLLLNRSSHVIKYTIENIINILERFLSQITNNSVLEITNIKETENLSYILHVLECLLKRYKIIKIQKDTQNICTTQSTQDEKYLKKSSISDIWRRKWNPSNKTVTNNYVFNKKCIELKCMEILNKIIVQAMDGYSLISFSALQCFNLLQS